MRYYEIQPEPNLSYILEEYSLKDLTTFSLTESVENAVPFETEHWKVDYSNAYKKGLKKHKNNKKVMDALKGLENFIVSNPEKPRLDSFPPELNAHPIVNDKVFAGATSVHLLGSKIIALFRLEDAGKDGKKMLKFIHVGTHQEDNPKWK